MRIDMGLPQHQRHLCCTRWSNWRRRLRIFRQVTFDTAYATIDLARARQAKIAIFNRAVIAETTEVRDSTSKGTSPAPGVDATSRTARALRRALPDLVKLDRYEARALARRNQALGALRLLNTSELIDENGGGPGVRLRKAPKQKR